MPTCLICNNNYAPFISFGTMPIANNFLRPDQLDEEYFFELQVGICLNCYMVQLVNQPSREMMFHEDYAYYSSTSVRQVIHFKNFAESVIKDYCKSNNPFVVELGSNDGIMLQNFANAGIRHLGIEPSKNVAQVAIKKGINTICDFFDEKLAMEIIKDNGMADIIQAANVLCHIPYIHSVIEGIKTLLKPDGFFIFEDPYMVDILEKTSYDQIYDEHVFYFSISSVKFLFEQHNMELVDIKPLKVHGGSMRYFIAHKCKKSVSSRVKEQSDKESGMGLHSQTIYNNFKQNVEKSKSDLIQLLKYVHLEQGKRIVGYGATSKSTTITNYCGINTSLVEFICDTTPSKQGKFNPGTHIPVKPYHEFSDNYPDYALLFAWNHAEEIMAKEGKFHESGGKWITYVPKVQVLE
ncbi:MAG: class I SAM-dependent methyltransferase [Desulfamplus sp.]|nr:class I SAM-dependent methyltransferase [Desulfamplus sp.]